MDGYISKKPHFYHQRYSLHALFGHNEIHCIFNDIHSKYVKSNNHPPHWKWEASRMRNFMWPNKLHFDSLINFVTSAHMHIILSQWMHIHTYTHDHRWHILFFPGHWSSTTSLETTSSCEYRPLPSMSGIHSPSLPHLNNKDSYGFTYALSALGQINFTSFLRSETGFTRRRSSRCSFLERGRAHIWLSWSRWQCRR